MDADRVAGVAPKRAGLAAPVSAPTVVTTKDAKSLKLTKKNNLTSDTERADLPARFVFKAPLVTTR